MSIAKLKYILQQKNMTGEQQIIFNRVILVSITGLSLFYFVNDSFINALFCAHFLGNVILFIMQLKSPKTSDFRRIVGICLDFGIALGLMTYAPREMAFTYPIFLWAILGNGFRYGVKWLAIAATCAFISFATVIIVTPYWQENLVLSVSLLVGMIIVPGYTAKLIADLSRKTKEAENANKAKSYFLASMSHELKTPLNAIIGYGTHLRDMGLPEQQLKMVDASVHAGEHLLHLINQIMQVSTDGKSVINMAQSSFKITDLMSNAHEIMAIKAEEKNLKLILQAEHNADLMIDSQQSIIQNILINLMGNAIKFTSSGTITISAKIENDKNGDNDDYLLTCSVKDTGIGIAPDHLEKIFLPFQQADETVLDRFGGTGLGLAICQQLTDQLGGTITVKSKLGQGSIFTVKIPVQKSKIQTLYHQDESHLPNIGILALGRFDSEILAQAQLAGNYIIKHHICENEEQLTKILDNINANEFSIAMISRALAGKIVEQNLWHKFEKLKLATILVDDNKHIDLDDIKLRAEFSTIIPSSKAFDEIRSALKIGGAFARHVGHCTTKNNNASSEQLAPAQPEQITEQEQENETFSILITDDNRTNLHVLEAILSSAGHQVTMSSDGDEALDILEKQKFDIWLLDINMPRMNGLEACSLWRHMETPPNHMPVLGVTADSTAETLKKCEKAGMDKRITKPINAKQILENVQIYCKKHNVVEFDEQIHSSDKVIALKPKDKAEPENIYLGNLNVEQIEQLASIDNGVFLASIIDEYNKDVFASLEKLHETVMTNDVKSFRFQAHAIKSASANLGAEKLATICGSLENITQNDFSNNKNIHYEKLKSETENSTNLLKKYSKMSLKKSAAQIS
ncbi:hypothetical protein LPB140_06965 [Sphingorhabdus lutea]|uniref:histidine kinase n=1 Tax=Sphingorhabdus lutea TaxID=1913578 RepID=A0A1L3JBP5_9SPHN|nr:hybrid sensor histidine kinase/response regulator [Sphingorhabdus lutea]APG62567.1 hypothetical protein LPB140_06965 [Sphingorhabdus lutea]